MTNDESMYTTVIAAAIEVVCSKTSVYLDWVGTLNFLKISMIDD